MAAYIVEDTRKITTQRVIQMKAEGKKIAMLTSYDYTTASIVDAAGVDCILIGDSASNVMAGNDTTVPMTVDEMIIYGRSVVRGVKRALVVCDMPFGSYQISIEDALRNAVRLMKETGADALKLEGGIEIAETIRRMVDAGIPVCGHLGLTPQSVHKFGGYGLRAKSEAEAAKLISDAHTLEEAGCFAIVLEKIPAALATEVSSQLSIPTIGIGAGSGCDGQVLVVDDMLGKNQGFRPKFLRQYANLYEVMTNAIGQYVTDVKDSSFPSTEESY